MECSIFKCQYPEEAPELEILAVLLENVENEIVEFKAASNGYDLHKLGQYFSAISNADAAGSENFHRRVWKCRQSFGKIRLRRLLKFRFKQHILPA